MTHPRLSVNGLSSIQWSFEQDLALWQVLGVHHAGLLISKIADDVDGKLARLIDVGIAPVTVVCGSFNLSQPDSWAQHQDHLCALADSLAAVDKNCSIYFTPGRTTGAPWDEVLDIFASAAAPAAAHARDVGIRMAFEPSLRTDVSFINTLRDSVDACNRTGLGMIVDFANCWMERGLQQTLLQAAPHIALVQIDDVVIGGAGKPAPGGRVNIGEGELPVDRLMRYVLDSGYQGPFDLEVLGPVVEAEGYEASLRRGVPAASAWLDRFDL